LYIQHGEGELKEAETNIIYKGTWVNGKRDGFGIQTYPTGDDGVTTYEGYFSHNKRNGKGTYIVPNDYVYNGEFANDKYDPVNNCYNGASYLFYMHQIANPRQVFPCVGGIVQPVYKYQVGTEGQEKEYFLTSLIPREVGLGKGKCEAVNDFNSDNSNSLFGDLFNAWISVIGFFGLGAGLGYWLIPSVRDNINASLRRIFSNNPTSYNSEFRAKYENSWGVFINGFGYYIPEWNCSVNYFKKRGFLPYIGEETAEARKLDLNNNVPYQGSYWKTDYENKLNQGAPMSIFQPKPIKENNLKDKGNQPYFMEFREGDIQITYETGFL
jgi:hypothetical protein